MRRYLFLSFFVACAPGITAFQAFADTPLCSAVGTTTYEEFGSAVAALDDVDDDEVPDFVVGSPRYNTGCTYCGRITIVSGADCSVIQTINGTSSNGEFGRAITRLHDIDDDTIADFAVSAPPGGYIKVYSGADRSVLYTFTGAYGLQLSDAGDINNDGTTDMLATSLYAYGGGGLGVDVYSLANGTIPVRHYPGANHSFGDLACTLTRSYNVGDNVRDILVDPPLGFNGDFRIVSGSTDNDFFTPDGIICLYGHQPSDWDECILAIEGRPRAESVTVISDINDDGYDELAFGTPGYGYSSPVIWVPGAVRVLSGAPEYPLMFSASGTGQELGYGSRVITIPDVDSDSLSDILVSSYYSSTYEFVEVISGATGEALYKLSSNTLYELFGWATSSIADVNDDDVADLLVGSPVYDSSKGRVQLFAGRTVDCNPNTNLYLQNQTETGLKMYKAPGIIAAGYQVTSPPYGNYVVSGSSANVSLKAGSSITLAPGFYVHSGAIFSAEVISGTCS